MLRLSHPPLPLSFRDFVRRVRPRFEWYRHAELLADVLQDVADGKSRRVMVFMPPRAGKSEEVSRLFSAYYLYRHPSRFVGLNSYAADLAYTLSRAARENYKAAGGLTKSDADAVKQWETPQGGGLWAAGVGGPITGKGFHLGIIDDPLKNAEEAASGHIREKQKEWYRSTFYTREEPGGAICIVQCMTGDTPVLMETGIEKPLRDIRPGDRIATYHNGRVEVSTVRNWADQGPDVIYEIRMKSGIIVRANARHPFLVKTDRGTEWQRTVSIKKGSIIPRVIGASGKELLAQRKGATSPLGARAFVCPTITSGVGRTATARLLPMLSHGARRIFDIATRSTKRIISVCLPNKAGCVRFANARLSLASTPAHIGAINSASTTATRAGESEDSFVTTATSPLVTGKQQPSCSPPLSTFKIADDVVVDVIKAGVENVYDIEVEHTENFIANGLVSHNTRWNEDDLSGWLLSEEAGETPERWRVVSLPAIAEGQAAPMPVSVTTEPDWRTPGEALNPARHPIEKLQQIRSRIGEYHFGSLYQQRPTAREGEFFKVAKIEIVDALPAGLRLCRAWDTAATAGGGDYTAGGLLGTDGAHYYIAGMARGQWATDERDAQIRQTAALDGRGVRIHGAQDPGAAGKDAALAFTRMLAGYSVKTESVSGAKETRADPFSSQVNAGNVRMLRADWNRAVIEELRQFPRGKHDDIVDALSDAFAELTVRADPNTISRIADSQQRRRFGYS